MRRPRNRFQTVLAIWTFAVIAFVLLPLFVLVAVSLTPLNYISLPTTGLSLRWYSQLASSDFGTPAWNSLLLAIEASISSVALGTLAALAITRSASFPFRRQIQLVLTSPLFVPTVMMGLAILIFFSSFSFSQPALRLYIAHTILTIPYVVRTVSSSLASFDENLAFASLNLGATPVQTFRLVTVPQIRTGIFAATIFAFIVSFDNVAVSVFLTGPSYNTLPVRLLEYTSTDNDPMSAALSVVMIVGSLLCVAALERFVGLRRVMS